MAHYGKTPTHYGDPPTHYGTSVTHYGNLATHYDTTVILPVRRGGTQEGSIHTSALYEGLP